MSDFIYQPTYGASKAVQPRVRRVAFGDGYEQRVAEGINSVAHRWSLVFRRDTADIDAIDSFLAARGGVSSFSWTPKGQPEVRYVCRSWSRSLDDDGVESLSATFDQVFEV